MQPGGASTTLQTADRALAVLLEFRSPGQALTVSGLATRLGLHRSTTSRLVSTLEARGFLERVAGEGVVLGREVARLGRIALAGRDLVTVATPVLEGLATQTGETVSLATAAETHVVTVAEAAARHFVSSRDWVGVRTPAHCASDGKVLIAFGALPFPPGELERRTALSITDPETLRAQLATVRRRGFAVARGELEDGLYGVAAPVFEGGACVAALCISGPEYRMSGELETTLAASCRAAAAALEHRLGSPSTAAQRLSA